MTDPAQASPEQMERARRIAHASHDHGSIAWCAAFDAALTAILAADHHAEAMARSLGVFALVADEYERWQRKGSLTEERSVRFGYGQARFGLPEFREARLLLTAFREYQKGRSDG